MYTNIIIVIIIINIIYEQYNVYIELIQCEIIQFSQKSIQNYNVNNVEGIVFILILVINQNRNKKKFPTMH